MQLIYYIADLDFSNPNASTSRIIHNAKAITTNNQNQVTLIGFGEDSRIMNNEFCIKNVKIGRGLIQKLIYYFWRGLFVIKLLKKEVQQPDLIVYYGCSTQILLPLLHYAHKRHIKIVTDIVEWYNYSHLPWGKFGPYALDVYLGITKYIPKCDGVVVISTYLQNYYISRNSKTIRVPALVDTENTEKTIGNIEPFDKKYLNLIYAGSPGKKDLVLNVIEAVEQLSSEGVSILLHLLGPTKSDLEIRSKRHFSSAIICYGKISQCLVPEYLNQADFSVFLRPNERYAQAGFPTKFVESMNAALPVIANNTSDLPLYLKDRYNGFVVKDYSVKALIEVITGITTIKKIEMKNMRNNSHRTAIENFDYRLYSEDLSFFFHQIIEK